MGQSLSKLYIHIMFHTKFNRSIIGKDIQSELYAYMGAIIKENQSIPIIINGVANHVHILCILSKNIALSKLVEEVKKNSSRWIKTTNRKYWNFAWQGGYTGLSVSESSVDNTAKYIKNQEEHHKKVSVNDELIRFLNEYKIGFDKRYLLE